MPPSESNSCPWLWLPVATTTPAKTRYPERPALNKCWDILFERHFAGDFVSFFYKPDLEDPETRQPFLTGAVICLCSRYLTPEEAKEYFDLPTGAHVCNRFSPVVRSLAKNSSDEPGGECYFLFFKDILLTSKVVHNIHAYLILALSEFFDNAGSRHWMYAGIAIRMAQIMRLNKDYHQAHSLKEREIRRRTFWACLLLDSLLAYYLSKPLTVEQHSFVGLALPATDASIAFQEIQRGVNLDNLACFTGYPSEIGITPYFIKTVSLGNHIANFNVYDRRFLDTKPPTDKTSIFYQRHQEMKDWVSSLPPGLQWTWDNYRSHSSLGQGRQFIAMHFLIRSSFCVAHQLYLPQLDGSTILLDTLDAAGWSLLRREPQFLYCCVTNALSVGEMMCTLLEADAKSQSEMQSVWVALSVLSVFNTLLWMQYASDPEYGTVEMANIARGYFSRFQAMLASWTVHWRAAQAWLDILQKSEAMYRAAYLGEFDQAILDSLSGLSPTAQQQHDEEEEEEERQEGNGRTFRPQPGDGYPPSTAVPTLYASLRYITTDTTTKPKVLQSAWNGFASGWTHDLTEMADELVFE